MSHGWWRSALFMLLAVVLDETISHHVAIVGVRPDLALLGLLVVTLRVGPRAAVWYGFAAGLFIDVASPENLGARALSFSVASYVIGRTAMHVDVRSLVVRLVLLVVMGMIDGVLYQAASHFSEPGVGIARFFGHHLPNVAYTALVAALVFSLFGRVLLPKRVRWREGP